MFQQGSVSVCLGSWSNRHLYFLVEAHVLQPAQLMIPPFHGLYTPGFFPVPVRALRQWLLFCSVCPLLFRAFPKSNSLFWLMSFYTKSYYILTSAELFPPQAPSGSSLKFTILTHYMLMGRICPVCVSLSFQFPLCS